MAKFIDTKRFQPVIYGNDLPHKYDLFHHSWKNIPLTEPAYVKYLKTNNIITDKRWWKKQEQRCINGYEVHNALVKGGDCWIDNVNALWDGDGNCYIKDIDYSINSKSTWISGRMYFYLNFWQIKKYDPKYKRKVIGCPRFTQLSYENWIIRHLSTSQNTIKDILWTKRRQAGMSEETAADLGYDFIFISESQNAIISGEDKYAQNTFRMVKRGMERLINTQFYRWTSVNNSEMLVAKYTGSELHCRTAKDNEQALSGLSPYKVLYEESGLWQKGLVRATLEFVNQSLEAEGQKSGQNIFISTAGDMSDSVDDVEYMYYHPKEFNLLTFKNIYEREETAQEAEVAWFVPGWKFEIIDEDGNNEKYKSIEKLQKDRDSKSAKERHRAVTMKPFYPSELFSIVAGGYFGQDIVQMINERRAYLHTHKHANYGKYYDVEWKNPNNWDEGVTWKESETGLFFISELPETNAHGEVIQNVYKAGIDSYDKDEANDSNSKGSMSIYKGFINANRTYKKFVARLTARPAVNEGGAYKFYEYTCRLTIMYRAMALIEWSNIRIFDYYKKNNMEAYMKERPELVLSKYIQSSKMNNPYGIDPSSKVHWLAALKDHLSMRENVNKIDDQEMLEAFAKFRYETGSKKYNCDITISSSLALVCYEDETEIEAYDGTASEYSGAEKSIYYATINGRMQQIIR
jgi:hypothetical protein